MTVHIQRTSYTTVIPSGWKMQVREWSKSQIRIWAFLGSCTWSLHDTVLTQVYHVIIQTWVNKNTSQIMWQISLTYLVYLSTPDTCLELVSSLASFLPEIHKKKKMQNKHHGRVPSKLLHKTIEVQADTSYFCLKLLYITEWWWETALPRNDTSKV